MEPEDRLVESGSFRVDREKALEKLGLPDKAFAAFARAASLNPNYAPAAEGMRRNTPTGRPAVGQG